MSPLDKAAHLAASAAAAREDLEARTASLDPPFPYRTVPFDLDYFTIPADPEPANPLAPGAL